MVSLVDAPPGLADMQRAHTLLSSARSFAADRPKRQGVAAAGVGKSKEGCGRWEQAARLLLAARTHELARAPRPVDRDTESLFRSVIATISPAKFVHDMYGWPLLCHSPTSAVLDLNSPQPRRAGMTFLHLLAWQSFLILGYASGRYVNACKAARRRGLAPLPLVLPPYDNTQACHRHHENSTATLRLWRAPPLSQRLR